MTIIEIPNRNTNNDYSKIKLHLCIETYRKMMNRKESKSTVHTSASAIADRDSHREFDFDVAGSREVGNLNRLDVLGRQM